MAYQNVQLMGGTIITGIAPTSALESPPGNVYYASLPSGYTYNASITLKQNSQIINNLPVWIYGNETWGIRVEGSFSSWIYLCLYFNGTRIAQMSVYASSSSDKLCRMCVFAGIDESTQKGSVFGMIEFMTSYGTANRYYGGSSEATNNTQLAYNFIKAGELSSITSNGGGATYIAKRTGQLKDLSSYTSDILIVSGGGGGGLLVGETAYTGKEAGGISGSGDNSADQSTGNAFGQGENGTDVSGGGSGLYGGYKGTSSKSGGAGSGYIGNSLLSNKKMVGYNVPTSSAESTKTESVSQASATPTPNVPKIGNGFTRVKLLNELPTLLVQGIDPLVHTDTTGIRKLDLTIPDADLYNKFLSYDSETGRFTVLRSFYAFIKGSVETSTDGTIYLRSYGQTRVNGTAILSYDSDVTPHATASASTYRQMEVGDLIDEYVPRTDGFPKLGIEITIAVPDNS